MTTFRRKGGGAAQADQGAGGAACFPAPVVPFGVGRATSSRSAGGGPRPPSPPAPWIGAPAPGPPRHRYRSWRAAFRVGCQPPRVPLGIKCRGAGQPASPGELLSAPAAAAASTDAPSSFRNPCSHVTPAFASGTHAGQLGARFRADTQRPGDLPPPRDMLCDLRPAPLTQRRFCDRRSPCCGGDCLFTTREPHFLAKVLRHELVVHADAQQKKQLQRQLDGTRRENGADVCPHSCRAR